MPDRQGLPDAAANSGKAIDGSLLVIDDDPAVRLSLESVLEGYGIRIAMARDGKEGIRLFRKHKPAVVLTDIVMPEQDGINAIIEMRRERPDVKIIAMSGAGRLGKSDFLAVAKQLGADAVMPKPLDLKALVAALRRYLPTLVADAGRTKSERPPLTSTAAPKAPTPASRVGEPRPKDAPMPPIGGKRTEESAAAVSAINQRIFETSQDLILVVDRRGTFIRVSPSSTTILGYEPQEMIGRSAADFLYGDDLESTRSEMRLARSTETMRSFECRYVHKLGTAVSLWWRGVWSAPETQYFFIGRDITDRKQAERRLQQLQAELAHVSRLTEMGQMAAALAHELNQPLTAAANYLETVRVLIERTDTTSLERAQDATGKAMRQVERVSQVIRHLHGFVKKAAPERKVEDALSLIDEARTLAFIGTRERGVVVRVQAPSDLPSVLVDKVQIQQVLVNILRNAVEAMEQSSRRQIAIEAGGYTENFVVIAVIDTGPGISEEVAERLFQPFVTTKGHGMGVGLSLCRAIVEAHGGTLWAEPNPEGGAIFRFTVPVAQ